MASDPMFKGTFLVQKAKLLPEGVWRNVGVRPRAIRPAGGRQVIKKFLTVGYHKHSPYGRLCWLIARYCEEKGLAYRQYRTTEGFISELKERKHVQH